MRAGRLITLLFIVQRRGRVTAAELAVELEVSERTVLRDIEELSGAGVPIYAVRGRGGGFELLGGTAPELTGNDRHRPAPRRRGRPRRAVVRISPEGRRLAALLGRPQPLRVRRSVPPDGRGWLEASFRVDSVEGAVIDLLSLSPHVELIEPAGLRRELTDRLHQAARLHPERPA